MTDHVHASARGMAFSETVLVTDQGPERLTRTERRLFVRQGGPGKAAPERLTAAAWPRSVAGTGG